MLYFHHNASSPLSPAARVAWLDATDAQGSRLSSGVYFYRLTAQVVADEDAGTAAGETFTSVKKMVLVK